MSLRVKYLNHSREHRAETWVCDIVEVLLLYDTVADASKLGLAGLPEEELDLVAVTCDYYVSRIV